MHLFPKLHATAIHVSKALIAYFTMFAMMTYNGTVIIAIFLGHFLGYFLFGFMEKIRVRKVENYVCCSS